MEIENSVSVLLNPNQLPTSPFLEPKLTLPTPTSPFLEPQLTSFQRKGSRKLSVRKKKESQPYSIRKGSFRKFRQDSLNQGT